MLSMDTPRHVVRLEGEWKVRPVPLKSEILPNTEIFEEKLLVPECANLQLVLHPDRPYWGDHLRSLNEQAWVYRKDFDVPDVPFRRARLRFEGVDYFAFVWLNGRLIGEHEGSFEPFTFDVTHMLKPNATNTLIVRISSPWDKPNSRGNYPINHVVRGLVKGHYEHGEGVIPPNVNPIGIWRPVHLLLDDGLSLDRVKVYPALDGTVRVKTTITNSTGQPWEGRLTLDAEGENHTGRGVSDLQSLTLPPGTHELEYELKVPEPRLWWPWDHGLPNLYRLTLNMKSKLGETLSTLSQVFGIRTVRLERSPDRFTWWINDRPVFLRGSSYMPALYLAHVTEDDIARDVQLARDANLNLLRVHVHVSPPEVYDICDRAGILIWQDFELNWIQDFSLEFEARARRLQRAMFNMLFNHPSIMTWTSHNEPTMVFAMRDNYERHPGPALYADALEIDSTRPAFICSGQMEEDWQRAGDIHTYYGAMWSRSYTDVYRRHMRMNTEFGFEAPAALETLRRYPDAWKRLDHLESQIDYLWGYQAELIQFHVEHLRRIRPAGSAGYVHFWLADLVPQVGCGVLDVDRVAKGGYAALQRASQPLQVAVEHDGRRFYGLWVYNDMPVPHSACTFAWKVFDVAGNLTVSGEMVFDVEANESCRVADVNWPSGPASCHRIELELRDRSGNILVTNQYDHPLQPTPRPEGYPWRFDPYLGFKVFARADAVSLVDQGSNPLFRLIPLAWRESLAEWGMRQKLPLWLQSAIARLSGPFVYAKPD